MKVLLGTSSFGVIDDLPRKRLTDAGFELVENPYGRTLTKSELLDLLPGVTGLIAGLEPLDSEVMQKSNLKVISRCGTGMANVDQIAAKEFGIKVCSTPDAPTVSVAELTIGAMLGLLRHVTQMDRDLHNGDWSKRIGFQLQGKSVSIIGFGRIGSYLAELLLPFRVRVIIVDPNLRDAPRETTLLSLNEALPNSDIVTLHLSGEEEILGTDEFRLIKRGAFILNAARGGLINEAALKDALDRGQVAGAWLDCFAEEPYSGPLTKYSQVILTPHVGSYTAECRLRMETEAVDNLIKEMK